MNIEEALKILREDSKDNFMAKWGSQYNIQQLTSNNVGFKVTLDDLHPAGILRNTTFSDPYIKFRILNNKINFDSFSAYSLARNINLNTQDVLNYAFSKKAIDNLINVFKFFKSDQSNILLQISLKTCFQNSIQVYDWVDRFSANLHFVFKYWTFKLELNFSKVDYRSIYCGCTIRGDHTLIFDRFGDVVEELRSIIEDEQLLKNKLEGMNSVLESLNLDEVTSSTNWVKVTEGNIKEWEM